MNLTKEEKQRLLDVFTSRLDSPTTRIVWIRPPIPDKPIEDKDGTKWDSYKSGPTLYFILADGPENTDLEREVRNLFAHADHHMKKADEERTKKGK